MKHHERRTYFRMHSKPTTYSGNGTPTTRVAISSNALAIENRPSDEAVHKMIIIGNRHMGKHYRCCCGSSFTNRSNLQRHVKYFSKKSNPPTLNTSFSSSRPHINPTLQIFHREPLRSGQPIRELSRQEYVPSQTHEPNPITNIHPDCHESLYGDSFRSKKALSNHRTVKKPLKIQPIYSRNINADFKCPFCPDNFSTKYCLERHIKTGHESLLASANPEPLGTTLYNCQFCPEKFPRQDYLQLHLQRRHDYVAASPNGFKTNQHQ